MQIVNQIPTLEFNFTNPAEFKAVADLLKEYSSATAKFGPFHSAHEGHAVILEELDELWDMVKIKCADERIQRDRMRSEALQVAAMGLRFAVDCCQ